MAGSRGSRSERLAALVASGATVRAAGKAVKLSERQAYRLSAVPEFKARVAELRSAMTSAAAGRLADGMEEAAKALRQLVRSPTADVKLKAAKTLIELGLKVAEVTDLRARLEAIEARLDRQQAGGQRPRLSRPA